MKKDKRAKRKKCLQQKRKQKQSSSRNKTQVNKLEWNYRIAEPSSCMFESVEGELFRSDYWDTEEAKEGFFPVNQCRSIQTSGS